MFYAGVLNYIIARGTDQIRLSYLEYDIGLRREAHEKMLRDLEADAKEDRDERLRRSGGKEWDGRKPAVSPTRRAAPSSNIRKRD